MVLRFSASDAAPAEINHHIPIPGEGHLNLTLARNAAQRGASDLDAGIYYFRSVRKRLLY